MCSSRCAAHWRHWALMSCCIWQQDPSPTSDLNYRSAGGGDVVTDSSNTRYIPSACRRRFVPYNPLHLRRKIVIRTTPGVSVGVWRNRWFGGGRRPGELWMEYDDNDDDAEGPRSKLMHPSRWRWNCLKGWLMNDDSIAVDVVGTAAEVRLVSSGL